MTQTCYDFSKMNEMKSILTALDMPRKLSNHRTILTLLAIAQLTEWSNWTDTKEEYSRIHDIITFINKHYPDKGGTDTKRGNYKENSRETIRDDSVTPLCELAVLEHNGAKSQSEKSGYRLTNQFALLLKSFGSEDWEDELAYYRSTHKSYKEKYSQIKKLDSGLPVTFNNKSFTLTRTAHNKLQKSVLEKFAPYFAPNSKLLYLGDTKKRKLIADEKFLLQLNIHVLEYSILPDIILYNEDKQWLLFVEAYTSTGEFTVERVQKIKEYCKDCPTNIDIIFVTAFSTMKKCKEKFLSIAWDTEIWVAEEPTHMIHKNGDRFIGAHTGNL